MSIVERTRAMPPEVSRSHCREGTSLRSSQERARYLNRILEEVRAIAVDEPELGLAVNYTRTRDDERFEKFDRYEGPDRNTLSFLTDLGVGGEDIPFWNWAAHEYFTPGDHNPLALLIKNYTRTVDARDDDG